MSIRIRLASAGSSRHHVCCQGLYPSLAGSRCRCRETRSPSSAFRTHLRMRGVNHVSIIVVWELVVLASAGASQTAGWTTCTVLSVHLHVRNMVGMGHTPTMGTQLVTFSHDASNAWSRTFRGGERGEGRTVDVRVGLRVDLMEQSARRGLP